VGAVVAVGGGAGVDAGAQLATDTAATAIKTIKLLDPFVLIFSPPWSDATAP